MNTDQRADRRGRLMLASAAGAGIVIALAGAVAPSTPNGLRADTAAMVNDRPIRNEDLRTAVTLLARDKRMAVDDEDRRRVLDRLIDEELLVQRAVALGLANSDPSVRKALASAIIDAAVIESETEPVSDAELRDFYRDNHAYFARPSALRVGRAVFRNDSPRGNARTRADAAMKAIERGSDIDEVAQALGDTPVDVLPDSVLPMKELRRYVGPSAVDAVSSLQAGGFTGPLETPWGCQILEVLEVETASQPAFEEISEQIRSAYIRYRSETALRLYLDGLRDEARIEIAPHVSR